jgi:Domain of unknown function (DUF4258)
MQELKVTRHARQRLQQRGVRAKELAIVMTYGDIEVPARDGCRLVRLSQKAVRWILEHERIAVQDVDRARRLMVLADGLDRVITVLKGDPERKVLAPRRGRGRR